MKNEQQLLEDAQHQCDTIDIEQFTKDGKIPSEGKWYRVRIGTEYYIFLKQFVSGHEILEKAGITYVNCYWLYQKQKDCDFEKIDLQERVNLAKPGIEHFIIKSTEIFHYFVDNEPETTDLKAMTPNQILEAAGITPVKDYYLVRINADGSQQSFADTPNVPIIMVCPAVKFVSIFRGETPVS
ncbi:multiubiquitin domain-containing protein [Parafilimonas sp.]|uniref:multiubiquitin domain-containing protein n=1 Tax=Parafilimonas sp. TaxID=1969739 RepID=UPI0039E26D2A